jgi:hypothetical protein
VSSWLQTKPLAGATSCIRDGERRRRNLIVNCQPSTSGVNAGLSSSESNMHDVSAVKIRALKMQVERERPTRKEGWIPFG